MLVLELAVRVVETGCRVPVPVPVLAVRVVKTGCRCWVPAPRQANRCRMPVPGAGAGV